MPFLYSAAKNNIMEGAEGVSLSKKAYAKIFIYILLFNIVFLSTTIVLHETGHYVTGVVQGCSGTIVLYDERITGPYTELQCDAETNTAFLYLGSFVLVVPFALLFLLLKGMPEKYFSLVIMGTGIYTAGLDLTSVSGMVAAEIISLVGGILVFIYGEYMVLNRTFIRFEEHLYFVRFVKKFANRGGEL